MPERQKALRDFLKEFRSYYELYIKPAAERGPEVDSTGQPAANPQGDAARRLRRALEVLDHTP